MIRFITNILLAGIIMAILPGCSDKDAPKPPTDEAPRTVLVYMIANNNLGYPNEEAQYDLKDIAEMELAARSGAFGDSRLLVFRHSYESPGKSAMTLLEITAEGKKKLKSYTDLPSSASEETMNRVIADVKSIAPARHYGIVLWSHASGWINTGIDTRQSAPRSFGYDGIASNAMSITSLANVLNGKGFDFIYFDCCYMAGVEVAYELRKAATWMVASAAELPVNGTPYHLALPYLMPEEAAPTMAAKATFAHYRDEYNPAVQFEDNPDAFGCTFSAIYLPAMDRLAQNLQGIYAAGFQLTDAATIQQFAPRTNHWYYCDLDDYVSHLDGVMDSNTGWSSYDWFTLALDDAVDGCGATSGIYLQNTFAINKHCGLTTYVPRSAADLDRGNYKALAWYRNVVSKMKF